MSEPRASAREPSSGSRVAAARDLIRISRPRFWLYLGGTYLVGFAFGARSMADFLDPTFAVHMLYFILPANVFLYGVNDIFDADTDQLNPKKGTMEHRLRQHERRAVGAAVAGAVALGVALMALEASWAERTLLCAFLALGTGYSAPPVRFKARPGLDFPSNALYAVPGFLGFVQASGSWPPALAVLGAVCWTGAMHLFSAIPDIEADQAAGLATSATVLGTPRALALCALLWLAAASAAITLAGGQSPAMAALIYPAIPLALLWRPELVDRAYWLFPPINAAAGFGLFLWAVWV